MFAAENTGNHRPGLKCYLRRSASALALLACSTLVFDPSVAQTLEPSRQSPQQIRPINVSSPAARRAAQQQQRRTQAPRPRTVRAAPPTTIPAEPGRAATPRQDAASQQFVTGEKI